MFKQVCNNNWSLKKQKKLPLLLLIVFIMKLGRGADSSEIGMTFHLQEANLHNSYLGILEGSIY